MWFALLVIGLLKQLHSNLKGSIIDQTPCQMKDYLASAKLTTDEEPDSDL